MARANRTCSEPGCPAIVRSGYCLRHNRNRRARDKRESSTKRTYDRRWRKLRKVILARDPICSMCGVAPSTDVDHIEPRSHNVHAADVTEEELQGLCHSCHSRKTQAENTAKSRDAIEEDVGATPTA